MEIAKACSYSGVRCLTSIQNRSVFPYILLYFFSQLASKLCLVLSLDLISHRLLLTWRQLRRFFERSGLYLVFCCLA